MERIVIVSIVVIIIIIAVILGIYFFMTSSNPVANTPVSENSNNPNNFMIQGMKVEILKAGSGDGVKAGEFVTVNYVSTLADGKKFDSSIDRNSPYMFTLGIGKVIKGWDLGVVGMKVGEKRKLTIPPELAYGDSGFPPIIPQKATLTFEIDMLKIGK